MTGNDTIGSRVTVLAGVLALVIGTTAEARVCTSISPVAGVGTLNCASAGACDGSLVGTSCGPNLVCVAFATRFNSACCTCQPEAGAGTAAALKCDDLRLKAEAKFVACHVKATSKAAKTHLAPDYASCVQQFLDKAGKIDAKYGADCPDASPAGQTANTWAGLLGDPGINPAIMQVCGNGAQWDNVQQLCVPVCGP